MSELIEEYIAVIYDSYLAHIDENNDYETFGHAMAIVLPQFMKVSLDLSRAYRKLTLEGASEGENAE